MKPAMTEAAAHISGRFETPKDKFFEVTKDRAPDVVELDVREALPGIVGGAAKMPRLVERVWRRSCDEVLSENRGIYCFKGGTVIQIFFHELSASIAKAKVAQIKSRIPQVLSAAQADESTLDAPIAVTSAKPQGQAQAPGDLARLLKDGLPENPPPDMLKMWVARVSQGMITSNAKMPLTREMVDLGMKSLVSFLPLWTPAGQAIVGSAAQVRGSLPAAQWTAGEPLRQDMAVLFSALFQLYALQSKGQNALMIVPVRAATLMDKDVSELYVGLLRRVAPELRKNLIIELCQAPKDAAPTSLATAIETLAMLVRAYIFDVGIFSSASYARQFPKLHACGFDCATAHVPEAEQARLMKKFAEHYHAANVKTYARGVTGRAVLDAAAACGFAYVSGPLIKPAQKAAFTLQKLPVAEIGAGA